MSDEGFSVARLLHDAAKSKQIHTDFADEYGDAPESVRALVDSCNSLRDVLFSVRPILDYGKSYPQGPAFARKLEECAAFIIEYKNLKSEFLAQDRPDSQFWLEEWEDQWESENGAYASDNEKACRLKSALAHEVHNLMFFIMVVAL
jgi:hypothetical protein